MPAKNSLKIYVPNGCYHLYNRGVEKRVIFQDEQDCSVFLAYLKEYLLPKDEDGLRQKLANLELTSKERDRIMRNLRMNNFADEIDLYAFCLMPNHFHLLIKQYNANSINKFMSSLCTRYSMYFNKRYSRVGPLFQGVYKAVLVDREEYLLYLSRYIHFQAGDLPSSLDTYLGKSKAGWVKPEEILAYFSKTNRNLNYDAFMGETGENSFNSISSMLLD